MVRLKYAHSLLAFLFVVGIPSTRLEASQDSSSPRALGVVGSGGEHLSGALVTLDLDYGTRTRSPFEGFVSLPDGPGAERKLYRIQAEGHIDVAADFWTLPSGEVALRPTSEILRGRLVDASGRGVSGMITLYDGLRRYYPTDRELEIERDESHYRTLRRDWLRTLGQRKTDALGNFAIPAPPFPVIVDIVAPGYRARQLHVSKFEAPIEISLAPQPPLVARVVDTIGNPVSGARVIARRVVQTETPEPHTAFHAGLIITTTDADGEFELDGGDEEFAQISIHRPGFLTRKIPKIVRPKEALKPILLNSAITIRGRLVGESNPSLAWIEEYPLRLRDGGDFEVGNLPRQLTRATLRVPGFAPEKLNLPGGDVDLGPLKLEPLAPVDCLIRNDAGQPARARLYLVWDRDDDYRIVESAATDAEGRARLHCYSGRGLIVVRGPGLAPTEQYAPKLTGNRLELEIDRPARLEGRIPGATSTLIYAPLTTWNDLYEDRLTWALTDAEGRFELTDAPLGEVLRLGVRKPGFAPEEVTVSPLKSGETRRLTLTAPVQRTLRGRILTAQGEGIPGLKIRGEPLDLRLPFDATVATESGEDGAFELGPLTKSRYRVTVATQDYVAVEPRVIDPKRFDQRLDFVLRKGFTWRGRVVDSAGEPIDGAMISVTTNQALSVGSWCTSGTDGRFALASTPEGSVRIRVTHPEKKRFELSTSTRDGLPEKITLAPRQSIRIQLDSVEPIEENVVYITLSSDERTTTYEIPINSPMLEIDGVSAGRYEIVIVLGARPAVTADIEVADNSREFSFAMTQAPDLNQLEVRDVRGQPVADARVFVVADLGHTALLLADGKTDASGRYTPPRPLEVGDGIVIKSALHVPWVRIFSERAPASELAIELPAPSAVKLSLLDADGRPAQDLTIQLNRRESGLLSDVVGIQEAEVDSEGGVEFSQLPAGEYDLIALRSFEEIARFRASLRAGESKSLEETLPRPVELRGRVTFDGEPLAEGTLVVESYWRRKRTRLDDRGEFALTLNRPGEYTLRVRSDPVEITMKRELNYSQELNLNLRTAPLEGQLYLASGSAAAGVRGRIVGARSILFETDDEGHFELDELIASTDYSLEVLTVPRGNFAVPKTFRTQPEGRNSIRFQFEPGRDLKLELSALGASAEELERRRARVYAVRTDGERFRATFDEESQQYRWLKGSTRGVIELRGYATTAFDASGDAVEVVLRPSGTLRIKVEAAEGLPAEGELVKLTALTTKLDPLIASEKTDEDGSVIFALEPGDYRVELEQPRKDKRIIRSARVNLAQDTVINFQLPN